MTGDLSDQARWQREDQEEKFSQEKRAFITLLVILAFGLFDAGVWLNDWAVWAKLMITGVLLAIVAIIVAAAD